MNAGSRVVPAAWRAVTLGAAASLSQPCAVRATTTREEEVPPLLAVARADATRRRAPVRPSRALVRVRTLTETRDSHSSGIVCAVPFFLLSISSWRNSRSFPGSKNRVRILSFPPPFYFLFRHSRRINYLISSFRFHREMFRNPFWNKQGREYFERGRSKIIRNSRCNIQRS